MTGRLIWVLHAHLPFVRHPEHPRFLEEDWLFEVVETSYLPLLDVFSGWVRDGLPVRVGMSLSPPLVDMLQDELLQARFRAHLDRKSAMWLEERGRHRRGPFAEVAAAEQARVARARRTYEAWRGNLVAAFASLEAAGTVELFTTSATHTLLPAYAAHPRYVELQLELAVAAHRRAFGRPPRGLWLPECGWFPGVEEHLAKAGLRYTFVEAKGVLDARPTPQFGLDRGVVAGSVLVLGRDPEMAARLWSRDRGLPGHPDFLDFHQDGAYELSDHDLQPFLPPGVTRAPVGLRRHRVTDRRGKGPKQPYAPARARHVVRELAVGLGAGLVSGLDARSVGTPAQLVAPFDAELFGHWWREGPDFLDALARTTADRVAWITAGDLLSGDEPWQAVEVQSSTWGAGADLSTWISPATSTWWGPLLDAVAAWSALPVDPSARPLVARARTQWIRELGLATASDWPFLIHHGTAPDYAALRLRRHLERAEALHQMVREDWVDPVPLAEMRATDALFPWLDPPGSPR